jgi:hypothetical protein
MKNKKYHNVGTILKSNTKIVERGKIDTPNTQIHDKIDTLTHKYMTKSIPLTHKYMTK